MGAGASALPDNIQYQSATEAELSEIFATLDVQQTGLLSTEDLIVEAVRYFDSLPTTQPETWISAMINKHDEDRDGFLEHHQFLSAVESLRRC